jgi:hypothetical protein
MKTSRLFLEGFLFLNLIIDDCPLCDQLDHAHLFGRVFLHGKMVTKEKISSLLHSGRTDALLCAAAPYLLFMHACVISKFFNFNF